MSQRHSSDFLYTDPTYTRVLPGDGTREARAPAIARGFLLHPGGPHMSDNQINKTLVNDLQRIYDAQTKVAQRLGSARMALSQADRDDDNNDIVAAYRTTCAYARLLKKIIDSLGQQPTG